LFKGTPRAVPDTRSKSTRRRREGLKKKRTGENEKNMHENRSVCIGDARSLGIVGMKV
jgi:hypothetical protein